MFPSKLFFYQHIYFAHERITLNSQQSRELCGHSSLWLSASLSELPEQKLHNLCI